jgi:hypothetical protein
MDMGMMGHRLAPCVQHGGDADLGAKPSGIGGDGLQCHGRDPHQQGIHGRLVLESDLGDCRRQGEDYVKVRDWQQIGDTGRDPLLARRPLALGTVAIAAGIIGDACQATIVAGIDVTAEPRRPASFDRTHDATLAAAKVTGVLSSVGRPMPPKDVGDFEGRAHPIICPAASPPGAIGRAGSS